eukprot:Rmarinus@m.21906
MAANQKIPIKLTEVLNLTRLGISAASCTFSTVTMESDKFICIREQSGETRQVVIVDMANPTQPIRRPIQADSALMNPLSKVIALKAGNHLQIFNIEMKAKMKSFQMQEAVVFWKWISLKTIGLVTSTAVYHWSMEGDSAPVKMFDRLDNLANSQIINYRTDPSEKWLLLIGISAAGQSVQGAMQLYSVEKKMSQPIEGHAAVFSRYPTDGKPDEQCTIFAFSQRTPASSKLHIIEVGADSRSPKAQPFQKKVVDVYYPQEAAGDFPVSMQISQKYSLLFMITKLGYLHLYDLESATCIYMNRISAETIFVSCVNEATGGVIGVNRQGKVLSVAIDENNIVPYICSQLQNLELATRIAARNNLPGAEGLLQQQFDNLFGQGRYKDAAILAAQSNVLRTPQTIQRFRGIPQQPGQPAPLLMYFQTLLDKSKLNRVEGVELGGLIIQYNRVEMLKQWVTDEKIDCSEELGDIVKQANAQLALTIYAKANAHDKVILTFVELGMTDRVMAYIQRVGASPDYVSLLQRILAMNNAQGALNLALLIANNEGGSLVDFNTVVDVFLQRSCVQEATSFLLDVLKGDKPEHAELQTRVLEINLVSAPQVADAILTQDMFSHYDKIRVAQLCERAGLYQRALDNYQDLNDVKRVIQNTHAIQPEFLVQFMGTLSVEYALECLRSLLQNNLRGNLQICIQIAQKYSDLMTPQALIELFESFESFEGLYYYLGAVVNFSQDAEVHFKYIEAASKTGMLKEVERVTRESSVYDPEKVKDFLKEQRLQDPRPLINVCDRFDMVEELTHYMYNNNMLKFIEGYVQKVNPSKTPQVVGALLDLDCQEEFVKELINSVGRMAPVAELVEEVEKRNRLKILLPWLEARVAEGNTESPTHDAIAKIYIDSNHNPEHFLLTNQHYDSKVVGKYCEKRDPNLAFIAYKRGQCDYELVDVTNRNSLFKLQARYVVERQSEELWDHVLQVDNPHRRQLIDQVVSTALPESRNPDEVAMTVRAFMNANLPNELIELLEKIVLQTSEFSSNRNLQNLLILTAIKADQTRVMEYINRLDCFDGTELAPFAIDANLYEEAFAIYNKFTDNVSAIGVLINQINDLERAREFAVKCDDAQVWSNLAEAQLNASQVSDAIESYIKANDPSHHVSVIAEARKMSCYDDLVKYLRMARKKLKEQIIDTELVFALAKTEKHSEMEEFISGSNIAKIGDVGERCYQEKMYQAAKILFSHISNFGRLASALVHLGEFNAAVDAARKANKTRTWKEVCMACVEHGEFRLAQTCGLQIIVHADEVDELIQFYESFGYFSELIALLEAGVGLERAHMGIFTNLGILYSKYKVEQLMEHIKIYWAKINIPRLIRACEEGAHYSELAFLYVKYDEYDNAALTMINHSPSAFEHSGFCDIVIKVANVDLYYRALDFYLDQHPMLINELLKVLAPRVDHSRVVSQMRKSKHLALVKPYLTQVQDHNVKAVNDALNELYYEEEDYTSLRKSIDNFDNFDQIGLAQKLEKSELLEFRRIAAYVFKKNQRWAQSMELSKSDKLYKDAMETAAHSQKPELAEELLRYFVDAQNRECFAATLYTCYDLIQPDVALECAWLHGYTDFAMPYLIQVLREYTTRVAKLEEERKELSAAADKTEEVQHAPIDLNMYPMLPAGPSGMSMGMGMQGGMGMGGQGYY